jgi:omega-6 fatty acid desaturase (delta-12 desaturase)
MAQRSELYSLVEPFGRPRRSRAVAELLETFIPYAALNVVMVMAVQRHLAVALSLSVLAAAFLVRLFIIFHDCCTAPSFLPVARTGSWDTSPGCSP